MELEGSVKVTDEMVERAVEAWGLDESDYFPEELAEHRADMRRTLEAALADVPEPSELVSRAYLQKLVVLQEDQLKAAESKLAKVREFSWAIYRYDDRAEFLSILDGEE